MDGEHLLSIYNGMANLTRQMLAAARGGEWDTLIALEKTRGTHFARLRTTEDGVTRDARYQRSKEELIRSVLENDAQIRSLVEPWQAHLLSMIGHNRKQRHLHEAYAARI